MQTRNPFLDDISKLAQGAAGAAQAAGDEVRALFRSQGERMATDLDLVRRDEVEALKTLARTAIERAEALEARVAQLEARLNGAGAPASGAPKG
jgi:BMFP domain-containing protein YqiC